MIIKKSHGFTLLEILLVVGIIAILAGIVIVAINPSRQLAQVRNTERLSDVKQINSAVMQYYIDKGYFPTTISTTSTEICNTDSGEWGEHEVDCTDLVDLSMLVPVYLTAIPVDPQGSEETIVGLGKLINKVYAATNGTNYWIKKNSTGKIIETTADGAELGVTISIPAGISNSGGDENYSCGDVTDSNCWSDTDVYGSQYAAVEYCSSLEDGYPAGTWYLPSKDELVTALTAQFITIPNTNIGLTYGRGYWSSTNSDPNRDDLAWYLYYNGSLIQSSGAKASSIYYRCVR